MLFKFISILILSLSLPISAYSTGTSVQQTAVNTNANKTQQIGKVAQIQNIVVAGQKGKQCGSQNYWACFHAALAAYQAIEMMANRGSNNKVECAASVGCDPNSLPTFEDSDPFSNTPNSIEVTPFEAAVYDELGLTPVDPAAVLAKIKSKGVSVDPKTKKMTIDGKEVDSSTVTGASSNPSSGLTPKQESKMREILKGIRTGTGLAGKFRSKGVGSTGGGYSQAVNSSDDYEYKKSSPKFKFNFGTNKKKTFDASGLSRKLASGESIGVPAGNIFKMMSDRYMEKNAVQLFDIKMDLKSKY